MDQKFIKFQENVHGIKPARKWLQKIPKIIEELKIKWDLEIGEEFDLSWNYIISTKNRNGQSAVLKIYFPQDHEYFNQLKTLQIFNGDGAIKVLENDDKNFAILLEKCLPGNTLSSLNNEEEETKIFCDTVKKLWKKPPANNNFSNVGNDLKDFDWYFQNKEKCGDLLKDDFVKKAQEKFKYLSETQRDLYLLHSDLHHENILKSERDWLAIDPKGVIGEREYEITAFMRNPIKRAKENLLTKDILLKRLDIICRNLDLDRQRIIDWCFAQTLLSVIWGFKLGSGKEDYWYKIAKELENLK